MTSCHDICFVSSRYCYIWICLLCQAHQKNRQIHGDRKNPKHLNLTTRDRIWALEEAYELHSLILVIPISPNIVAFSYDTKHEALLNKWIDTSAWSIRSWVLALITFNHLSDREGLVVLPLTNKHNSEIRLRMSFNFNLRRLSTLNLYYF